MIQILLLIIYVAFISLGLPDGLLGAAWPTMYINIGVPISTAGIISMVIAFGTIISALFSDKLTYLLGIEKVTALSVAMTCVALFGFSFSDNILALLLWSIPYGLGAGSVDAALNNYVAIHYSSRHMSWLHCMWGIGASIGPYLMGYAISSSKGWEQGYIYVGSIQIVLTVVLFLSFPLWKGRSKITDSSEQADDIKPMKLIEIIKIPGVNAVLITFFCYSALESTSGLWAASYLQLAKGIDEGTAASMASLFYIGITVGRAINGFLTIKLSDTKLIRLGQVLVLMGVVILMLPLNIGFTLSINKSLINYLYQVAQSEHIPNLPDKAREAWYQEMEKEFNSSYMHNQDSISFIPFPSENISTDNSPNKWHQQELLEKTTIFFKKTFS